MFAALKTENFAIMFSVILGFAIPSLLIPVCKGDQCFIKKAPSAQEMKKSTMKNKTNRLKLGWLFY
jgi:hypothetical protein